MITTVPLSRKRDEPLTSSTAKMLTTGATGVTFLVLSGLTFTGAVMILIFASPVIVLFSPILVPVGIILLLSACGFVFSGGFAVAAIASLSWLFRYVSDHLAANTRRRRDHTYGGPFVQLGHI